MSKMAHYKIIHNPRCSKSRQTLELLKEQGVTPEIVEYLKTPLTKNEIEHIVSLLNITPHQLLRTKETEYKEAQLSKDASTDVILGAMVAYPKLIERPIVIKDERSAVIGRPPENVLSLI
jgi:arsenate reductase (glutaredoxin)